MGRRRCRPSVCRGCCVGRPVIFQPACGPRHAASKRLLLVGSLGRFFLCCITIYVLVTTVFDLISTPRSDFQLFCICKSPIAPNVRTLSGGHGILGACVSTHNRQIPLHRTCIPKVHTLHKNKQKMDRAVYDRVGRLEVATPHASAAPVVAVGPANFSKDSKFPDWATPPQPPQSWHFHTRSAIAGKIPRLGVATGPRPIPIPRRDRETRELFTPWM